MEWKGWVYFGFIALVKLKINIVKKKLATARSITRFVVPGKDRE
jgi:hypothetical protein